MINNDLNQKIIILFNKHIFIDDWLSHKYKEKPLAIYGGPGVGKTTIAKYILKDWTTINIQSDICNQCKDFNSFLVDSLYKKNIKMMFNSKHVYKALIIDDIFIIQKNDKKLFKSITDFSKKKVKNNPIIYILNNINNKSFKNIISQCYPFKIEYSDNQLSRIIREFFIKDHSITDSQINDLIIKSNKNLHNILVNIDFYNNNFNNINKYQCVNDELSKHISEIINTKDIQQIYNKSYSDYTIIGLNILESFYLWIEDKKLNNQQKLLIYDKIYQLNISSDNLLNNVRELNDWRSIDHIITLNILYPVKILQLNNIIIKDIPYNKYISKCIIYIHNTKLLSSINLNIETLSFLYYMIYLHDISYSPKIKSQIINFINFHNIPINITEKFLKYFYKNIHKNKIKMFYK